MVNQQKNSYEKTTIMGVLAINECIMVDISIHINHCI